MADDKTENLLAGLKPVLELLERAPASVDQVYVRKGRPGGRTDPILDLCRRARVRFTLVPGEALDRMLPHVRHQGVAARLRGTDSVPWADLLAQAPHAPLPLLLALDQVQDPGNVGTLARTLYALGAAGLVLPRHNSAFLGSGARRAAAGALECLPVAEVTNLSRALEDASLAGFTVYAAARRPDSLDALTAAPQLPALLVLGGEDRGIRPGVLRHCRHSLAIPFLRGFDSLNVAQAGAILVACFARAPLAGGAAKAGGFGS
jgi:23S rRNA (guanosine2251-2'-O)-methyltransferase